MLERYDVGITTFAMLESAPHVEVLKDELRISVEERSPVTGNTPIGGSAVSSAQNSVHYYGDDFESGLIKLPLSDARYPLQWSTRKKCLHTLAYGVTTLGAQFGASILSPSISQLQDQFHVGEQVAILCMSVYLLGNAAGPMLFAPLSEVYGRKIGVLVPYLISALLLVIVANVNSAAAVIVLRFFAGAFAAAPVVIAGGAMADMWPAEHRAAAMVLYSDCIVLGNSFGPIFGALLAGTGAFGWRWSCYLAGVMGVIIAVVNLACLSESYVPVLDQGYAHELRHATGNWALHAANDEHSYSAREFVTVHMARPLFLFLTPIVFLMASFASFVFGVMYLVITSVGDNFSTRLSFSQQAAYLPLICNALGFCIGGCANLLNSRRYATKVRTGSATPEDRLPAMMALAWLLPAGCFIYAWTLRPSIHWVVPCLGVVMVGAGISIVFQGCLNYIVDTYTRYAASAIAANTVLRSLYGGLFPLFAKHMYRTLGTEWGGSLVGFMAMAMLPIPFVFYFYGARIRRHNPYANKLR